MEVWRGVRILVLARRICSADLEGIDMVVMAIMGGN